MSKKKDQNEKPYAYINKEGKGEAPVTFAQLVKLVHAGVLKDEDKIRRQNEAEWKRVADADWLMYLPDPESNTPSQSYASPAANTQPPRKQQKKGRKGLVLTGIGAAAVLIIGIIAWMILGGGGSGDESQEQALAYVERELEDWRAGRDTDLCLPVRRPILLSYEIVDVKPQPRYNTNDPQRFDIAVQLTFSSVVGGRPVVQHTFTVQGDPATSQWKLSGVPYLNM